ncbi:unnamed protein product [Vitrella brassicaformis CCMP3155]|uniref:Uncharacterized protein n=1 Tax=Vitrella brassicaformis (strain CCMP3155) TaxID=1169540 RepID=A0A0G4ESD3_VITBC|nr:unnamed protein product [Vitrella brassicaformis CCMP3155]|eukprot:CEM00591.1 unnamed protein product [Vitrella brassicaformis CCMP3155]
MMVSLGVLSFGLLLFLLFSQCDGQEPQDAQTELWVELEQPNTRGGNDTDLDDTEQGDQPSAVDVKYTQLVKSIPATARRLFKPANIQLDTVLFQLHFLHVEQRLFDLRRQGVSAALARDDPFTADSGSMRLLLGSSFHKWRGLFRNETTLRQFAQDTATQVSSEGIVVDMTIDGE